MSKLTHHKPLRTPRVSLEAYAILHEPTGKWVVYSRQGDPYLVDLLDARCLRPLKGAKSYIRWRRRGLSPPFQDGLVVMRMVLGVSAQEKVHLPEEMPAQPK